MLAVLFGRATLPQTPSLHFEGRLKEFQPVLQFFVILTYLLHCWYVVSFSLLSAWGKFDRYFSYAKGF